MAGRIGSGLDAPASKHDGSCPGSMCWRLEVYAPSKTLPSVIHKGGLWRRRDGPPGLHRAWSERLRGAPPLAFRLSVRSVWLDGGGLTSAAGAANVPSH